MNTWTAVRLRDMPKTILTFVIGLSFITTWLPFLRSFFDGASYQWALDYFGVLLSGRGLTVDYIFLIIVCGLYFSLFISTYWARQRWIYYLLLAWWWIHFFGNLLYDIVQNGDTMFHGDTMNIHISISSVVIPLSIVALVLITWVILTDRKQPNAQLPWTKRNTLKAAIVLGPLLLLGILLSSGTAHGISDMIGVSIAILQCFVIPFIFSPVVGKD